MKRILAFLCCAAMVLGLAACNTNQEPSGSEPAASESVELKTSESTDFISFTPCGHSGGFSNYSPNVYETLLLYEDGELKPNLATEWEMNGNEITLKLREDVKFSDGEAFNAEAVKVNLESLYEYQYDSVAWFQVIGLLDHVEAVDEYTVKIVLTQPYYAALYDLASSFALGMMSPACFEVEGNPYENVFTTAGTGPYTITDYEQGSSYVFERNDNYWGEAPAVDKLTVNIVPDLDSRLLALRSGEADFLLGVSNLSYDSFDELSETDGFTAVKSENHSKCDYILFNSANTALQDAQVREALSEAIDKESMVSNVLYGLQENAAYMFDPALPNCALDLPAYESNKEHAGELLDAAGWKLNDATGLREKDGQALTLKLVYQAGYGSNDSVAQFLKSELEKVGVELTLESFDLTTYSTKIYEGSYDMALAFSYGVPYDPHVTLSGFVGYDLGDVSMQSFDFKEELNGYLTELMQTTDSEKVAELTEQALTLMHENYAAIPLTYEKELVVFNNEKISGIEFFGQPGLTVLQNIVPAK